MAKRDKNDTRVKVDLLLGSIGAKIDRLRTYKPLRDSEILFLRAALRDLAAVGGMDLTTENF